MNDLIARLEKAIGADRSLDRDILEAINPKEFNERYWARRAMQPRDAKDAEEKARSQIDAPHYTASLDAALTLVPKGCITMHAAEQHDGKWFWGLHMDAGYPTNPTTKDGASYAFQTDNRPELFADGSANAAIAACIASLKARAAIIDHS